MDPIAILDIMEKRKSVALSRIWTLNCPAPSLVPLPLKLYFFFVDIAVGAPYDGPEGRGAVYIFHGSGKGIMEKPSQVIQAEDVVSTLSTFGFSVAGGMDLDENEYPDLVVGAYEADTAVYLRYYEVIKMFISYFSQHKNL